MSCFFYLNGLKIQNEQHRSLPLFCFFIYLYSFFYLSNFTRSLKISGPQLLPRACTSSPPSESPPSWIGEKPRFSASAPISAAASSSSLARNTTLLPPFTAGSWLSTPATKWLKPFTNFAPVKACATAVEEGCPPSSSGDTP